MNAENTFETSLWKQLISGDEEAFSLLFEKYYGLLLNYGKTLLGTSDLAKDCVQDVFVDIWTYRHSLNQDVVIKAYLLSSVRKRIARQYEREHIFLKSKELDSVNFLFDFSIEDKIIENETIDSKVITLNKHINELPPRQKEALYLRYNQGLSVTQVSEILDMNYQSTKNLLHRSILQLRKEYLGPIYIFLFAISENF